MQAYMCNLHLILHCFNRPYTGYFCLLTSMRKSVLFFDSDNMVTLDVDPPRVELPSRGAYRLVDPLPPRSDNLFPVYSERHIVR